MAALAKAFGVERAALTGLVDRAERRDLVQRRPVPADRRAIHVALTGPGRRIAHAFHTDFTTEVENLLTDVPVTERDRFHRTLLAILAAGATRGRVDVPFAVQKRGIAGLHVGSNHR